MGVYTRESLLHSGLSRRALSSFHRVLAQIYSDTEPSYLDRCTALTLWKPTAVLSHASAAWMWGLTEEPALVEATVPLGTQVRGPQWVRLHRRTVTKQARTNGLPVVPIEHCLIEVATTMKRPDLEALFDAAIGQRVNWRAVAQMCAESSGRHGIAAVREQLRTCCPKTRSEPERAVARALTARNFRLEINTKIGRYYGDLVCRRAKVIVEIDGRKFHIEPEPFNNDRKRQNALIADGWRILRYSAATAMAYLDEVVDEIISVVRQRRRSRRA